MTAIKTEDVISSLQQLELIQYRKGQHVICADPKVLDRHLKAAGRAGSGGGRQQTHLDTVQGAWPLNWPPSSAGASRQASGATGQWHSLCPRSTAALQLESPVCICTSLGVLAICLVCTLAVGTVQCTIAIHQD